MSKQKGFAALPILLAILLGLVVIGGGAYWYTQNKQSTAPTNSALQTATSTAQAVSTTGSSLQTYTNTQYGFSLQYPSSVTIKTGSQIPQDMGAQSTILELHVSGSSNDTGALSVIVDSNSTDVTNCLVTPQSPYLNYIDRGMVAMNGVQFHSFSDSSTGNGVINATRVYNTIHGNTCYSIAKSITTKGANDSEVSAQLDSILQSVRFTSSTLGATTVPNASPLSGPTPLKVTFSNLTAGASDEDLSFGDGTTDVSTGPTGAWPNGGVVTHTYHTSGTYTATIYRNLPHISLQSFTITVRSTSGNPSATIDQGPITSVPGPSALSGTASGVSQIGIGISDPVSNNKVAGSGLVSVINGRWSTTVTPTLVPGTYQVTVYNYGTNQVLATGSLTATPIPAATIDQNPLTTSSPTPTISGTASGISQVRITIRQGTINGLWGAGVCDSGLIPVTNGRWSTTVSCQLQPGNYTIHVDDSEGEPALVLGALTIQ